VRTAESEIINRFFLESLLSAAPSPEVVAARNDANDFCEYCFRDDQTGFPIKQAWHHREWQRLTDEHDRLVAWFPIEHGKSTQTKMKLCRLLGQHGDRQYAYISSKYQQGAKMVGAVGREILGNDRLRQVYPGLRPQLRQNNSGLEEWGRTAIRVADCPRGSKDPSLVAYGVKGQILGARLHGAIIDNALDAANTRSKANREWLLSVLKDEVLGRILPGGFVWILDTAWFHDDMMHEIAKQSGWHSVRFDAEDGHGRGETLWPEQWPRRRLESKLLELGQTAYDRQFRNRPLSESMNFFKSEFWDAAYGKCPWLTSWPLDDKGLAVGGQLQVRTGVDLAVRKGEEHDLTAFATVVGDQHLRKMVNLQSGRMEGPEIARRMVAIYRAIHKPVNLAGGNAKFIVEDNAAQAYIVQMFKDAQVCAAFGLTPGETSDIRIAGRTTTANKRHSELGIQGIASAIEMGRWEFGMSEETSQLRDEMRVWSPSAGHYGDRLMALWIAAADIATTRETFTVDYV